MLNSLHGRYDSRAGVKAVRINQSYYLIFVNKTIKLSWIAVLIYPAKMES